MKKYSDEYLTMIVKAKEDLKKQKITNKRLSEETGISTYTLYRYFNFKRTMPLDLFLAIKNMTSKQGE